MKRIIAAALSILVGAFGYTIVDSAIEDRVSTLESRVVELEGMVSSYHNVIETISPTTNYFNTTKTDATTAGQSTIQNKQNDMTFAGLSQIGYDVFGGKPYIYIDDKVPTSNEIELWENSNLKNEKLEFVYKDKQYLIRLNKGQYISGDIGAVGGEVAVFTKLVNSADNQYYGASETDWLKMEMTVYWDEFDNGKFIPQFTRHYNDFWRCVAYGDGRLKDVEDTDALRILCRITFDSNEQTVSFENSLLKKGFLKVENFSPNEVNTFKRNNCDVIFVW